MQCLPNPYTESTARYRPASPQSSEYFLRRCTFLSRWSTGGQKVTTAISKSNLWEYPVFIVWEKREINDTWSLRGERHEYDGREKPVAFMCVQHTPKKQKRLWESHNCSERFPSHRLTCFFWTAAASPGSEPLTELNCLRSGNSFALKSKLKLHSA